MKNIKSETDDSLRPEYKRSDLGDLVRGKFGVTQVGFAELTAMLLACIGEDERVKFIYRSAGNYLAERRAGEWTYEIDNANQITLRYWLGEFRNVEEATSNSPCVMTAEERSELQDSLVRAVTNLKQKVSDFEKRQ
jgi:hypothetical protein